MAWEKPFESVSTPDVGCVSASSADGRLGSEGPSRSLVRVCGRTWCSLDEYLDNVVIMPFMEKAPDAPFKLTGSRLRFMHTVLESSDRHL